MRQERNFGLDLVRAAAIVLVLLSHCGDIFALWLGGRNNLLLAYGGQFGVQLFFVLSGLLIGGLLIDQLDAAGARDSAGRGFGLFMARRWMRTLPLYYAWGVVLAVLWAPILWQATAPAKLAAALPLYTVVAQNLAWPIRAPGFYDVTWSLAVEEWFYLGFAGLLFGLWRLLGARAALMGATALFLAGPIVLRWWTGYDTSARGHIAVYWLDAIAVGVVAAWVRARHARAFAAAAWLLPLAAGLVVLMYAGGLQFLHVSERWARVFSIDAQAVTFALLMPAAVRWRTARGPVAWLVRAVSRYSYAVYLVHLSVLEYLSARHFAYAAYAIVLAVGSIVVLSVGLSHAVEQPIMALRPGQKKARGSASSPKPVSVVRRTVATPPPAHR